MAKPFQSKSPAMPKPAKSPGLVPLTPEVLPETAQKPAQAALQAKTEALAMVQTLQAQVASLAVTTEEEYQLADEYLGRIRSRQKWWGDRMEGIIRPLRQGLDALYALNREVSKPLEQLETAVKRAMADYKTEERRRLQAEENQRLLEAERLRREAEMLAASAAAATPKVAKKLDAQRAQVYEKLEAIETAEPETGVQALHSGARPVIKWRIKDMRAFLKAVGDGTLLPYAVKPDEVWLNKQFREIGPEDFAAWPGIEVYEDTQVVGR